MKTTPLKSQTQVPILGQGTWRMGEKPSQKQAEINALRLGIDLGYLIQEINNKQQQQRSFFFTPCNYKLLQKLVYTA